MSRQRAHGIQEVLLPPWFRLDLANEYLGLGGVPNVKLHVFAPSAGATIATFRDAANLADVKILSTGANAMLVQAGGSDALGLSAGASATPHVTIASAGDVTCTASVKSESATGGLGYATGAGGEVTQITSKSTGVEINAICGRITTHDAALAAGAEVGFTVTNSAVLATDCIVANYKGAGVAYDVQAQAGASDGVFYIRLSNLSTGSLSEAVVINFAIIRAVIA